MRVLRGARYKARALRAKRTGVVPRWVAHRRRLLALFWTRGGRGRRGGSECKVLAVVTAVVTAAAIADVVIQPEPSPPPHHTHHVGQPAGAASRPTPQPVTTAERCLHRARGRRAANQQPVRQPSRSMAPVVGPMAEILFFRTPPHILCIHSTYTAASPLIAMARERSIGATHLVSLTPGSRRLKHRPTISLHAFFLPTRALFASGGSTRIIPR